MEILTGRTSLRVGWAGEGPRLCAGTVAMAPPGQHVLLTPVGTLALFGGPKVAFSRPSADVLFMSVAAVRKDQAIGVVLTGYGRDSAAGAIKASGGRIIAQDPATAVATSMPEATIRARSIDYVLPLARIAPALISLCSDTGAASLFYGPPAYTDHLSYQS